MERRKPDLIKASRKRRIAAGAGVQVQEVNRLLNQFEQMQKMMKMMASGGLAKMMRNMKACSRGCDDKGLPLPLGEGGGEGLLPVLALSSPRSPPNCLRTSSSRATSTANW